MLARDNVVCSRKGYRVGLFEPPLARKRGDNWLIMARAIEKRLEQRA